MAPAMRLDRLGSLGFQVERAQLRRLLKSGCNGRNQQVPPLGRRGDLGRDDKNKGASKLLVRHKRFSFSSGSGKLGGNLSSAARTQQSRGSEQA